MTTDKLSEDQKAFTDSFDSIVESAEDQGFKERFEITWNNQVFEVTATILSVAIWRVLTLIESPEDALRKARLHPHRDVNF